MHPLTAYLEASGEAPPEFAKRADVDTGNLYDIIAKRAPMTLSLARRISKATAGAVTVEELFGHAGSDAAPVIDISQFRNAVGTCARSIGGVEPARLAAILCDDFAQQGVSRVTDSPTRAAALISEATANLFDLLGDEAPVDPEDRLRKALLSVLRQALAENPVPGGGDPARSKAAIRQMADRIARRYFHNLKP